MNLPPSFSTSPTNPSAVQTGPGMRPIQTYAAPVRVASPGAMSAQQAFVYSSYPLRSPPAASASHLIHTSPAAMSVLAPHRQQSPFDPLPPQHQQPIYST